MSSVREDSAKGIKWAAIEKFSVEIVKFGLGIIMARLLTPDDYGTIGMLAIFIAISQTFVDSGFSTALIRKLERTQDDYSTVFYFNIVIAIICYTILFGGAPWVASFYNRPILEPILRVHALTLIINSFFAIQMTKLTIDINFKAIARSSFYAAIISGFVGVSMAYYGFGVWSLVGQSICSSLVNLICITISTKWRPSAVFSVKSFKGLFGFGSNILGASLLNTIYSNLNTIVIGKFYTPASLGYYTRGTQFARLPVDNINGVLSKVTFPVFSKIQNDDEHLRYVYRKYIRITSMCIFFGCTLMAAIGKPLVLLVLSEKWAQAIIFLQIYSFAIMFDHINSINVNLIKIKGRSDLVLRIEIIKKIIATAILFASIPFGVIGICISKIFYSQMAILINTYYNGKLLRMGYICQLKDYSKYFIISILACIPAFTLTFINLPYFLSLLIGAFMSCFFYWYILRKDALMKEVITMVISKLHK